MRQKFIKIRKKFFKVKLADSSLTQASLSTPTWQWTAPEVFHVVLPVSHCSHVYLQAMFNNAADGARVHEACDLYSFGMILWEIWSGTGETPFEAVVAAQSGKKTSDFMTAVVRQNLRPACGATWDITQLIELCWEKDSLRRPSFSLCVEALTLYQKVQRRRRRKFPCLTADLMTGQSRAWLCARSCAEGARFQGCRRHGVGDFQQRTSQYRRS